MHEPPVEDWPSSDALQNSDTLVSAPPPAPPPPPPDRRIGAGMLLALGALVLAAAGIAAAWFLTHRGQNHHTADTQTVVVRVTTGAHVLRIGVPDVRGLKFKQAMGVLHNLKLGATQAAVPAHGKPVGTVVNQSPKAGAKVAKGSQVLLSVARVQPKPDTTSTTGSASSQTSTSSQTTTTPAVTETSSQTATTTAAPPQPATATVPDLSGRDQDGAAHALAKAGLIASIFFVPSSDPLGTVEGQAKQAGTTVRYRSHVQVNVSKGPGTKPSEQVPNVVGKSLQEAVASVNASSLRLIYVTLPQTTKAGAGKITRQSPSAGSRAPKNAQVVVYLAVYRPG